MLVLLLLQAMAWGACAESAGARLAAVMRRMVLQSPAELTPLLWDRNDAQTVDCEAIASRHS